MAKNRGNRSRGWGLPYGPDNGTLVATLNSKLTAATFENTMPFMSETRIPLPLIASAANRALLHDATFDWRTKLNKNFECTPKPRCKEDI